MIDCDSYIECLRDYGIDCFTGVPDSLLKEFCACVSSRSEPNRHVTAANEGGAVAFATGHYMATGRPALVYMQNSGLGNAVNPLVSLAAPEVYGVPMLLLVGWRGEPGRKDEPQHVKQGAVTIPLLEALKIPCEVHPDSIERARTAIGKAVEYMKTRSAPFAFVVRAGTFEPFGDREPVADGQEMSRETAVTEVAGSVGTRGAIVASTGRISRELFEYRVATGGLRETDFMNVGAMGHASQIAMAVAESRPDLRVFCFDGDGALLMHMGSLAIIGARKPVNLTHIVFNNAVHDSVGGQPTVADEIELPAIARACGYRETVKITKRAEIRNAIEKTSSVPGPAFIEILVNPGARPDLGRPTIAPIDRKRMFMDYLARS